MNNNILTLGYVPGGTGADEPFDQVFHQALRLDPIARPHDFAQCDAIVIWGGADISPSIYNEPVSAFTGATAELSMRDRVECRAVDLAIERKIPIIGVCRGAQLLCAKAGGKLIQHVAGHFGDHKITTKDGRSIVTSSVHHQMLYPWDIEHEMIAWSSEVRSKVHYMGDNQSIDVPCEPEIVYFPTIRGLAIQGHPEFMNPNDEFVVYCNGLVEEYLLGVTHGVA